MGDRFVSEFAEIKISSSKHKMSVMSENGSDINVTINGGFFFSSLVFSNATINVLAVVGI